MLEFLRKYQKYFFIVISTMVITSFVFFGTFSTFTNAEKREDRSIGKAIDGSELMLFEIAALSRFLSSDRDDVATAGNHAPLNLLNDGVVRRDLLASGVAEIIVRGNFELFKEQLNQKIQRVRTYRSYEHPEAPFISAKAVWQRFTPDVNREWGSIQSQETAEANEETFGHLVNLYQLQTVLPAESLRRVLLMQEQQCSWLRADQRLRQDDLSLFGFHTLADWFGKDFVDLMAEFVHSAALIAEEKGYRVSLEEAKGDLRRNFTETVQKLQAAKWPVELGYKDQIRILGMDEAEAAKIWQKVLLFRRYFSDLGESAFLDRLPYQEFYSLAEEKATVDVYGWPAGLKMKSALDLYSFQTYLKAVALPIKNDPLGLPAIYHSVEEVVEKAPELVGIEYKARVYAVDKREASLKAPLKEVWDLETEEKTWQRLKNEFSFLQPFSGKTVEERFQVLEKLALDQRSKVDFFARRLLVEKHPEWIQESLDGAQGKETQLVLSNGKIELRYIDDPERLGKLFGEILVSPENALAELNHFETEEAVFRFENIEKVSEPRIKTFEEAMKDGSLAKMVDSTLESEFPKIRMKLAAEKAVKELSEIKEEVADLLLADLKKAIDRECEEGEDASLAARRWKVLATRAKRDFETGQGDGLWLKTEGESSLAAQFKLERTEKEITRTGEENWMAKESFILVPNQWSPVHIASDGGVHFIYLKNRISSNEPILEQLSFGKGMLVADVHRVLAEKLLDTMQKKKAIVIPLQSEQE